MNENGLRVENSVYLRLEEVESLEIVSAHHHLWLLVIAEPACRSRQSSRQLSMQYIDELCNGRFAPIYRIHFGNDNFS